MSFLLRCDRCGAEYKRKYPARSDTLMLYACQRRSCGGSLILIPLSELWKRRADQLREARAGEINSTPLPEAESKAINDRLMREAGSFSELRKRKGEA